jgi:hypothetical protein
MFEQIGFTEILTFVIPGFITVWSFRNFTHSKKIGDFEYLGLSIFWGLIMVVLNSIISPKDSFREVLGNPFAAAIAFSFVGCILGFWVARIANKIRK